MKDELLEFVPDASSRKTATDWLMKVISAKKPISMHLNGSEASESPEDSESAVAVEELPRAPEPVLSKRAGWADVKRETAADKFTAEDLCGAPAVPVIRVIPSPGDAITADDVCWVPVERRLKPEPEPEPEPELAAPKLKIVPAQEREAPTAEMHEPKRAKTEITAEDISREPAPFVVEPIWNGFAAEPDAPEVEQEISAADIARDWVLNEMSPPPPPRETRDGAVLPFSFKVIQSPGPGRGAAEQAEAGVPEAKESAAAGLVEAGESGPVGHGLEMISAEATGIAEETSPTAEWRLDVPARIEISTEIVAEMPEPMVAEAPDAMVVEAPKTIAAEPVVEPNEVAVGLVAEMPVEAAPEVVAVEPVEAAEPGAAISAADEALEESAAEAEIETALHDAEISGEDGTEEESVAESVFARESFWEEAAGANGAARGEAAYEKPVLQRVKQSQSLPQEMAEMGQRPEGWVTAWKTLLRLGSVLPWVARALPMIEANGLGEQQAGPSGLQEMRQDVSGLRLVQYEIRTTVQDHSMQLKRMEEQLGRVRESVEAKGSQTGELAESVRSMTRLVRLASVGLGGMLLALIVLVIVMLAHGR